MIGTFQLYASGMVTMVTGSACVPPHCSHTIGGYCSAEQWLCGFDIIGQCCEFGMASLMISCINIGLLNASIISCWYNKVQGLSFLS